MADLSVFQLQFPQKTIRHNKRINRHHLHLTQRYILNLQLLHLETRRENTNKTFQLNLTSLDLGSFQVSV